MFKFHNTSPLQMSRFLFDQTMWQFVVFIHHDCLSSVHVWTTVPCPSTPLLTAQREKRATLVPAWLHSHQPKKIHTLGEIWAWARHCSLARVHPGTSHHLQDLWCYFIHERLFSPSAWWPSLVYVTKQDSCDWLLLTVLTSSNMDISQTDIWY